MVGYLGLSFIENSHKEKADSFPIRSPFVCVIIITQIEPRDEHVTWLSQTMQDRWANNPEYRQTMIESSKRHSKDRVSTPEGRAHMSKIAQDAWNDPSYRKKQAKSRKEAGHKHAANMKAKWQDPEFRLMMKQRREELQQDPVYRKKQLDHIKRITSSRLENT